MKKMHAVTTKNMVLNQNGFNTLCIMMISRIFETMGGLINDLDRSFAI